jgi:hypothetical protein
VGINTTWQLIFDCGLMRDATHFFLDASFTKAALASRMPKT